MGIILNDGQKLIKDMALDFIFNSSNQLFEFKGDPGTGKSVVINKIVEESGIDLDDIACMAYTGQASIVMRSKGLSNAKTVHASQYEYIKEFIYDEIGNIITDPVYGIPIYKTRLERKSLADKKLIIIDEGYMIPYSMREDILSNGVKIIVSGDSNQLDPIGDKPAFLYNKNIPALSQIMRQKENSGIIHVSKLALNGMKIPTGLHGDDCLVIYEDELNDDMILNSNIILCGRNSTREKFNNYIRRELLNINSDLPVINEKVICRKNNWDIECGGINLANGLIGTVTTPPSIDSFDGHTFKMSFTPDMFNLSYDLICDYKYFIADYKQKEIIKNSPYSIGEKFDFAYSITTHLAQGAQFQNVIYYEEYVHNSVNHNKLNFVGASRATDKLIYVKKYNKRYY